MTSHFLYNLLSVQFVVITICCHNNLLSRLSVVGCYALRPKSLSMPYSGRAYTLYGSPALQGWER